MNLKNKFHLIRLFLTYKIRGEDFNTQIPRLLVQLIKKKSYLQIRFSPGLWRLSGWLKDQNLSLLTPVKKYKRRKLGIDEIMSKNGIPRLLKLLSKGKYSNGKYIIGRTAIDLKLYSEICQGKASYSIPDEIYSFLPKHSYKIQEKSEAQWKDIFQDKLALPKLNKLLKHSQVFYLGSTRTKLFATAIGVPKENHICIPNINGFPLRRAIVEEVAKKIEGIDCPIIIHTASIFGSTILAELANLNIYFKGFDMGLAGSIFDYEYLASRPWFQSNAEAILAAAANSINTQLVNNFPKLADTLYRLNTKNNIIEFTNELYIFNKIWRTSISMIKSEDLEIKVQAVNILSEFLANAKYYYYPYTISTLLLWKLRFCGELDLDLMDLASKEKLYCEPLISAYIAKFVSNYSEKEKNSLFERLKKISPYEPILQDIAHLKSFDKSSDLVSWDKLLTIDSRGDYCSRINWVLGGDLRSGRNN